MPNTRSTAKKQTTQLASNTGTTTAPSASLASGTTTLPASGTSQVTSSAPALQTQNVVTAPPTPNVVTAPVTSSTPYSRPKSKKILKNVDLCDFAVTELIHDFKHISPAIGEPEINGISSKRYNDSQEVFDRILSDGLNGCGTSTSFIKYTEPEILEEIAGANFKANISNGTYHNQNITVSTGSIYNVRITSKTEINESSPGVFDDSECGIKLFDNLFKKDAGPPILLIDVDMGITKYLKTGNSGGTARQVYMFSPVVVRADSATKMNLNSKPDLKKNFDNQNGIKLINVLDNSSFTTTITSNINTADGFFSKYTVESYENGPNIDQEWRGFSIIGNGSGSNKVLIRPDVNQTNNRTSVAKKIDPIINVGNNEVTGPNSMANSKNANAGKNREIFNSEIQSKRSGDWLPVIYILNYDPLVNNQNLKTYTNPIDPTTKGPFSAPTSFNRDNMYIVTNDTPLVAFSLYSGVNVILINEGNFIKLKKIQP